MKIEKWVIVLDSTQEVLMYLDKEKEPWALSTGTSCIKLTGEFKTNQYEEVEVVRYLCSKCNAVYSDSNACCNKPVVRLKGMIKREVKPKVKHREKVGFATPTCYIIDSIPKNINCDLFAEWED